MLVPIQRVVLIGTQTHKELGNILCFPEIKVSNIQRYRHWSAQLWNFIRLLVLLISNRANWRMKHLRWRNDPVGSGSCYESARPQRQSSDDSQCQSAPCKQELNCFPSLLCIIIFISSWTLTCKKKKKKKKGGGGYFRAVSAKSLSSLSKWRGQPRLDAQQTILPKP